MPINYSIPVVSARLQVVATAIDEAGTAGFIRLGTLGMAQTLALVQLSLPSASVSGNVLTFLGTPLGAPLTFISGYIESADVEDGNHVVIASGLTVGNSTAYDIVMNTNLVSSGQTVALTYATITGT